MDGARKVRPLVEKSKGTITEVLNNKGEDAISPEMYEVISKFLIFVEEADRTYDKWHC